MSSIPSEAQVTNGRIEHDVGVAGPPPPTATAAALAPVASDAGPLPLLRLWNPQSIKGWVGSLTLHGTLLVALGCWYLRLAQFGPRNSSPASQAPSMDAWTGINCWADRMGTARRLALSDEPDAFESPKEMDRLDSRLPSAAESPTLSLTAPSISLDAAAPLVSGKTPGPTAGDGAATVWKATWAPATARDSAWRRFGNGGEVIRGVAVKVGDPQFTLIWDAKSVDIDLHVIEPKGDHLYFGHRNGRQGGELDVDNTWGYGPENIYWLVSPGSRRSPKVKGAGPTGAYRWSVHYYAAHREDRPHVHWQVRIKHAGEVEIVDGWLDSPGEWSQIYGLKVHPPNDLEAGGPEPAKPAGP